MEDNTFLSDEEENDFNSFININKQKFQKLKNIAKKSANMGILKLRPHQKDDILLGGMFKKIKTIGDRRLGMLKPNKFQAKKMRNFKYLPPSLKSRILAIAKRREAGRKISVEDNEIIKTIGGIPITRPHIRLQDRPKSAGQLLTESYTRNRPEGKPNLFGGIRNIQKPMKPRKPKVNLGESPADAVLTSPEMVVDTSTPSTTIKKKPPYLLYGAIGVVGLLVAIKMFK